MCSTRLRSEASSCAPCDSTIYPAGCTVTWLPRISRSGAEPGAGGALGVDMLIVANGGISSAGHAGANFRLPWHHFSIDASQHAQKCQVYTRYGEVGL